MLLSEGQMSDFKGAESILPDLPQAKELLADKGYDANWFREALAKRKIKTCIPSKSNRTKPIPHDKKLYRQRHKIENMFGKLKVKIEVEQMPFGRSKLNVSIVE